VIDQQTLNVAPIDWLEMPRTFLNPGEMEVLIALLRTANVERMLEIGCNTGRTAKVLLHNLPGIQAYYGVDVPPTYRPALPFQVREIPTDPGHYAKDDPRFHLIVRPRGSQDLSSSEFAQQLDAAFIDGDHSEAAVQWDTTLCLNIVAPGGILIWHDYHALGTVGVKAVLDQLVDRHQWPIMLVQDTWLAYRRL
jgi:predicted O-methyltransferase YrrM